MLTDEQLPAIEQRSGIYEDIPNAEYHADKTTFSSSLLKKMEVPLEAKYVMENPPEYK